MAPNTFSLDQDLLEKIIGRNSSLFAADIESSHADLIDIIEGSKVLVVGAAGSIGSVFVSQLIPYRPATLHLIDINENGLVEIVRELRSSTLEPPPDFRTFSIGMGSPEFLAFVRGGFDYDFVLNFAALKHVRAERDPYTLLRMLNTNFVHLDDFLNGIPPTRTTTRVFSVSSDKAVDPVSLLGASKALMEEVLWKHGERFIVTSARFANVAFSAGSLLESFLHRVRKRQPLAAPNDVRRFFISHEEAGQLCLLGAFLGGTGDIVFPALDPQSDMLTFSEIALTVLAHFGYEAEHCETEQEARDAASRLSDDRRTQWPVFFSGSDTSGEKMYEDFYRADESVVLDRWNTVGLVHKTNLNGPAVRLLDECLDALRAAIADTTLTKENLVSIVRGRMPGLTHIETGKSLDEKM